MGSYPPVIVDNPPGVADSLEARLDRLVGRNGRRHTSPWIAQIVTCPWPVNIRPPEGVPTYNGESDPEEFVRTYQNVMQSRDISEYLQCKLVNSYLRSSCLSWFESLPRESLRDYYDFSRALMHRYNGMRKKYLPQAKVAYNKAGPSEEVRQFHRRYMDDSMKVVDREQQAPALIAGFIAGLRDGELWKKLMENIPTTFHQLDLTVEMYCSILEGSRKRKEEEGFPDNRNTRGEKSRVPEVARRDNVPIPSKPRNDLFTPLTKSRAEIFDVHSHLFPPPSPVRGVP